MKIPKNIKAVLFDMDGVIVDSMPYHFIAWYEALRPFGVRVNCFDVYAREGEKWEKSIKEFMASADVSLTEKRKNQIYAARERIFRRYFKRHFFLGAEETLKHVSEKNYRLGLVTGTRRGDILKILPARIRKYFQTIVSGDSVKKGKPHPEPYLKAASSLGMRPEECVVIENAPYGIRSAKRAGMFCVAITTSLPREYLKEADMFAENLKEVCRIFIKKCKI